MNKAMLMSRSESLRKSKIVSNTESLPSSMLGGNFNIIDAQATEMYLQRTATFREVTRKEDKLNKFSSGTAYKSELKISKKREKNDVPTIGEVLRHIDIATNTDMTKQFLAEVDFDIMNRTQLHAERLFHIEKLKENFPAWIHSLNRISDVADAKGHFNKSNWRSDALLLLRQSLLEMEDDPDAIDCKIRLRKIALEINVPSANALVRTLHNIKQDYIRSLDAESNVRAHSVALRKIERVLQSDQKVVPHGTDDWSADLEFLSTSRSIEIPDNILNSFLRYYKDPSTLDAGLSDKPSYSSIYSTATPQMPSVTPLPALKRRERKPGESLTLLQVIGDLRCASSAGDFDGALALFKRYFKGPNEDPKVKYGRFPPNMDTFHTLMHAFKNCKQQQFYQAYLVMDIVESYGIKPDVLLYNSMMQACERNSRWRRVTSILRDMTELHAVMPNATSYEVLINCCRSPTIYDIVQLITDSLSTYDVITRHAVDHPAVIYETLRLQDLPQGLCYKAALTNAANRLSVQTLNDAIYDARDLYPNDNHAISSTHASSSSPPHGKASGVRQTHKNSSVRRPAVHSRSMSRSQSRSRSRSRSHSRSPSRSRSRSPAKLPTDHHSSNHQLSDLRGNHSRNSSHKSIDSPVRSNRSRGKGTVNGASNGAVSGRGSQSHRSPSPSGGSHRKSDTSKRSFSPSNSSITSAHPTIESTPSRTSSAGRAVNAMADKSRSHSPNNSHNASGGSGEGTAISASTSLSLSSKATSPPSITNRALGKSKSAASQQVRVSPPRRKIGVRIKSPNSPLSRAQSPNRASSPSYPRSRPPWSPSRTRPTDCEEWLASNTTEKDEQRWKQQHAQAKDAAHLEMQWKHICKVMRDTLPSGSRCKQAQSWEASNVAFQTAVYRAIPATRLGFPYHREENEEKMGTLGMFPSLSVFSQTAVEPDGDDGDVADGDGGGGGDGNEGRGRGRDDSCATANTVSFGFESKAVVPVRRIAKELKAAKLTHLHKKASLRLGSRLDQSSHSRHNDTLDGSGSMRDVSWISDLNTVSGEVDSAGQEGTFLLHAGLAAGKQRLSPKMKVLSPGGSSFPYIAISDDVHRHDVAASRGPEGGAGNTVSNDSPFPTRQHSPSGPANGIDSQRNKGGVIPPTVLFSPLNHHMAQLAEREDEKDTDGGGGEDMYALSQEEIRQLSFTRRQWEDYMEAQKNAKEAEACREQEEADQVVQKQRRAEMLEDEDDDAPVGEADVDNSIGFTGETFTSAFSHDIRMNYGGGVKKSSFNPSPERKLPFVDLVRLSTKAAKAKQLTEVRDRYSNRTAQPKQRDFKTFVAPAQLVYSKIY